MPRRPPFSEPSARAAIAQGICWADALRSLGYVPKGSNIRTLQRWARRWGIETNHFDANAARAKANTLRQVRLEDVMTANSSYPRGHLKRRLFATRLKQPICEMCGQGELWKGSRMSLVLDHINGISNDHRLENLRVLCPNCAATLQTHCGRNVPRERVCATCNNAFVPQHIRHRYCSPRCWGVVAATLHRGTTRPETRKVPRPSQEQLLIDLSSMSFVAVGRKYGVSDNAVRKWLRWYENQAERERAAPPANADPLNEAA